MAIYHNGKQINTLYHNGKQINTLYHNGKQIYQWYLPENTILWSGNTGFTPTNESDTGGGTLTRATSPIQLSESIEHIKNGLIFNFGGGVYVNTTNMGASQSNTSTKVSKSNLGKLNVVVSGNGLWADEQVSAQIVNGNYVSFKSSNFDRPGPMSTCIGWVNSNNNAGYGTGYYFAICKSIMAY